MEGAFRWGSPLGIAVALFTVIGALWILIGSLTVPLSKSGAEATILFISTGSDTAFYGDTPSRLLGSDPVLDRFRTQMLRVIAGFLLLAGTLVIAVTWFALRRGEAWSLWALMIGSVAAIALWVLALAPYVRSGVRLTLADLPPFMWIPAVLLVPATVLGWIGTR